MGPRRLGLQRTCFQSLAASFCKMPRCRLGRLAPGLSFPRSAASDWQCSRLRWSFARRFSPLYPRSQPDHEVPMIHRYFFRLRFLSVIAAVAFVVALPGPAPAQDRDNTLHKLNESIDALIRKVSPSVVQILVTSYGPV